MKLTPRAVIEGSRRLARMSRDLMAPTLDKAAASMRASGVPADKVTEWMATEIQSRMEIVMDCYNTGAAEMLKMLNGDFEPELWEEDYSHEKRLAELFHRFHVDSKTNDSGPPKNAGIDPT